MELLIALFISAFIIVSFIIILKDSINDNSPYNNIPIFFITIIFSRIIKIPKKIFISNAIYTITYIKCQSHKKTYQSKCKSNSL